MLVTGGAGFIGSNVVAALNDTGRSDVAVCDLFGHDGKWRYLAKRQLADIVSPADLPGWTGAKLAFHIKGRGRHAAGDRRRRFYRIEPRGRVE